MNGNLENIVSVIHYIEEHLTEKMNLDLIAGAVGYSKYHLHRMFLSTVGLSIHDYVKRRQLTEAAKLLVFSDKPILEISLLAGYESQQAFTNIFRQMYKKSPNEYRMEEEFYPLQLRFELEKYMEQAFSWDDRDDMKEKICFAKEEDIPLWMDLVCLIVDGYPHLDEKEYRKVLKDCIQEKRALILKRDGLAAAVMILNYDTGCIDFFGVHPLFRKNGIAKLFLDKVMNELLPDTEISITTFREGDKADTGYRKAYQALGFAEAELLVEFGYPTQRMVLTPDQQMVPAPTGGQTDE